MLLPLSVADVEVDVADDDGGTVEALTGSFTAGVDTGPVLPSIALFVLVVAMMSFGAYVCGYFVCTCRFGAAGGVVDDDDDDDRGEARGFFAEKGGQIVDSDVTLQKQRNMTRAAIGE